VDAPSQRRRSPLIFAAVGITPLILTNLIDNFYNAPGAESPVVGSPWDYGASHHLSKQRSLGGTIFSEERKCPSPVATSSATSTNIITCIILNACEFLLYPCTRGVKVSISLVKLYVLTNSEKVHFDEVLNF